MVIFFYIIIKKKFVLFLLFTSSFIFKVKATNECLPCAKFKKPRQFKGNIVQYTSLQVPSGLTSTCRASPCGMTREVRDACDC